MVTSWYTGVISAKYNITPPGHDFTHLRTQAFTFKSHWYYNFEVGKSSIQQNYYVWCYHAVITSGPGAYIGQIISVINIFHKFCRTSKIGVLQLSESDVQHMNGGPILKWYPVREILYVHIRMYCISLEIAHPYDKQFCMYVTIICYKFCNHIGRMDSIWNKLIATRFASYECIHVYLCSKVAKEEFKL